VCVCVCVCHEEESDTCLIWCVTGGYCLFSYKLKLPNLLKYKVYITECMFQADSLGEVKHKICDIAACNYCLSQPYLNSKFHYAVYLHSFAVNIDSVFSWTHFLSKTLSLCK
jgi:hypothetical protein